MCPMTGYPLENDLLKNLHPDSRMEKFRTRWTTLDVDWMWAVVEIAPVASVDPFEMPSRSIGQLLGRGIHPRGTRMFLAYNLLKPGGGRINPLQIRRCSLPPFGRATPRVFWTPLDDSSPLLESPLPWVVGTWNPKPGIQKLGACGN
ncbi:hypothetical protein F2Q69_00006399 [Brassica cretica]|uniref:Uncharacterized protein n=1 Tax=Brassica cretica TaxID=69181 RepID=A0A8S9P8Q2_BRACR|nr:hypothetical protein F2Q69_00006399 [Brassica cretica]